MHVRPAETERDPSIAASRASALLRLHGLIERQSARLAGVLHDDASQVLAYAHVAIEHLADDVPPEAHARLAALREHLRGVAEQLRRLSHELHPGIVDDLGLADAITYTVRVFARRTGLDVTIDAQLETSVPAAAQTVVYRVVHEALANIEAHAHASAACISLAREMRTLVCTVSDNGVGFDETDATGSSERLGLMLSRARLEALGGTLDIISAPCRGTCVRAVVPLDL